MYLIAVKLEGLEKRRRSTGLIHVILGLYLMIKSVDLYHYLLTGSITPVLPFLLVGAVSLVYGLFRKRLDARARHNPGIRLLQAVTFLSFGVVMLRLGKTIDYVSLFIWAALSIILFFSEKRIFKENYVTIQPEGLLIPGQYRLYPVQWDVLEDVIIRHDFLTILHKDKKYLQFQVMQDLSELELAKMNAFCKEYLDATKSETIKGSEA